MSQQKNYQIALVKDKRLASFNLLAWLIIIINTLSLYYFALSSNRFSDINGLLISLTGLIFLVVLSKLMKWNSFKGSSIILGFLLSASSWFILGFPLLAIADIVICLLLVIAERPKLITVTEQHLELPSFPKRTVDWKQLNNLLLKDGIITIDFKNNKLLQQEIDGTNSSINEQEFNDFCKVQIDK